MTLKVLFSLFFCLWAAVATKAQNFEKYYTLPNANEELRSIAPPITKGNRYIASSAGDIRGIYLLKIDSTLKVLKEKRFRPTTPTRACDPIAIFNTTKDGVCIVGETLDSNYKKRLYIVQLDSAFNITHELVPTEQKYDVLSAKTLRTGEIVIMNRYGVGSFSDTCELNIYDPLQKAITKTKKYGSQYSQCLDITTGQNDEIYFFSQTANGTKIVKTDKNLSTEAAMGNGTNYAEMKYIAFGKDGSFYGVHSAFDDIYKFDKNGIYVSTISNSTVGSYDINYLYSDTITHTFHVINSNYDLYSFDKDFNFLAKQNYGASYIGVGNQVTTFDNNRLLLIGTSTKRTGGSSDGLILQLKRSDLNISKETLVGKEGEASSLPLVSGMAESTDGNGFVFSSTRLSNQYNGTYNISVYRIDSTGKMLWTSLLPSKGYADYSKIVASPDGGYAVASYTRTRKSFFQDVDSVQFFRLNSNGQVTRRKAYPTDFDEYFLGLKAHPQGGYVLATNKVARVNDSTYYTMPAVYRLNEIGDTVFTYTFFKNNADVPCVTDVIVSKDGGIIVTGYNITPNTQAAAWIGKINSSQQLVWSKFYAVNKVHPRFNSVLETADGTLFAVGQQDFNGSLYRLNANGDSTGIRLSTTTASTNRWVYGVVQDKTNNNILTFQSVNEQPNILTISPMNMQVLKDTLYAKKKYETGFFYTAIPTKKGIFAAAGVIDDDVYIIASNGKKTSLFNIKPITFDATIYPNPVRKGEQLSIKINSQENTEDYDVTIFDTNGKILGVKKSVGLESTLNLPVLPMGMYYLSIRNPENQSIALPFAVSE